LVENDHLNNGSFEADGHIRCFAHSLNLCVQRIYEEMSSSIEKIREVVKSINRSSIKKEIFKDLLEKKKIESSEIRKRIEGLISDVSTRWNSTYAMLKRAIELKDVKKILLTKL
jgi:hypothetical protein